LSFDGVGAFVLVNGAPLLPPWTAEFWVNRQDATDYSATLLGDSSTALKLEQFNFTRRVGFTKFGVADYLFNYVAPTNTWVHLAFVCDTSTRLYVNGVLTDSNSATISLPLGQIASDSSGHTDHLRGVLDEVRVWSVARSQTQIQANMNTPLVLPQNNLFAYWRFDEGTYIVAHNSSAFTGLDGTLFNNPAWVAGIMPLAGPTLIVPANQTTNDLSSLSVTASAEDADFPTNSRTFSLGSAPLGMTINPTNGAISWFPLGTQGGSVYPVEVLVSENAPSPITVSNSFTVVVNEINKAPVLTVPANRTNENVSSLTLVASASDADVPVETFTYTLLSPPTGITINPTTGVIKWGPTAAQTPSTNLITVVVADNGSPSLSATNSFVIVLGKNAPIILSTTVQNHGLTIAWNAVPGKSYQLQSTTDLANSGWSTLSAVTASNSLAILSDSLTSPRRFYRVESVP
jgi:hypothetical protein